MENMEPPHRVQYQLMSEEPENYRYNCLKITCYVLAAFNLIISAAVISSLYVVTTGYFLILIAFYHTGTNNNVVLDLIVLNGVLLVSTSVGWIVITSLIIHSLVKKKRLHFCNQMFDRSVIWPMLAVRIVLTVSMLILMSAPIMTLVLLEFALNIPFVVCYGSYVKKNFGLIPAIEL